jgi:putative endonuclease
MGGYVYILTNRVNTVFYIGVTSNLQKRMYEHQQDLIDGFSRLYKTKKLVYFEEYPSIVEAITIEKRIKNWHRGWKINLIKSKNPEFIELTF